VIKFPKKEGRTLMEVCDNVNGNCVKKEKFMSSQFLFSTQNTDSRSEERIILKFLRKFGMLISLLCISYKFCINRYVVTPFSNKSTLSFLEQFKR
jgi:hypothetical protein